MLIKHKLSSYIDDDELELCAGSLAVLAHRATIDRPAYMAASITLRLLQQQDIKDTDEFVTRFAQAWQAYSGEERGIPSTLL